MPNHMLRAAGQSFVYSAAIGTLWTRGNLALGLCSGVSSAVSSLIDSMMRPLIYRFFPQDDRDGWIYSWSKSGVTTIIWMVVVAVVSPILGVELEVGMAAWLASKIFLKVFDLPGIHRNDYHEPEVHTIIYV
jgi:uncharacterized membrane protein YqaE (UPF0057 family)